MWRDVEVAFIDHKTYVTTGVITGVGGRGQELLQPRVGGGRVLLAFGQQVVCQRPYCLV